MTATFTKWHGDWVLAVQNDEPPAGGQKVAVTKRDGTSEDLVVVRVIRSTTRRGVKVHLCTFDRPKKTPAPARTSAGLTGAVHPAVHCHKCGVLLRRESPVERGWGEFVRLGHRTFLAGVEGRVWICSRGC